MTRGVTSKLLKNTRYELRTMGGIVLGNDLLRLTGITKFFPGVRALTDVTFDLQEGEVHALVGENGAGKSTLCKILAGIHQPDSGMIQIANETVEIPDPHTSQVLGIAMIFQERNLLSNLSVAENIFFGKERRKRGFINWPETEKEASKYLNKLGVDINPSARVEDLTVAQQQLVEIAKALAVRSRILLMDEPTSVLNEEEKEHLFSVVRELKSAGVGIIYISHHLDEVLRIADRITVLRDGTRVSTVDASEAEEATLVRMMVGRDVEEFFPKQSFPRGELLMEVKGLTVPGKLENISFKVFGGEVLGIAGLLGCGKTELSQALFGILRASSGEVYVKGKRVSLRSPKDAVRLGVGLIPSDRKREGLVVEMTVHDNLTLAAPEGFTKLGFVDKQAEKEFVRSMVNSLRIKTSSPAKQVAKNLSGGNQQKVVIGKWLGRNPDILILCEPTQGIDVGAKVEIYGLINRFCSDGKAVILISSELPEVLNMSDRVMVMRNGRIVAEYTREEAQAERVASAAVGVRLSA